MVKPKEKLGFYGFVVPGKHNIFLVLKVAPEMAPGVGFQLRKWPKVPFGAKMRILRLQGGIPWDSMESAPAPFPAPIPAPNTAPAPAPAPARLLTLCLQAQPLTSNDKHLALGLKIRFLHP